MDVDFSKTMGVNEFHEKVSEISKGNWENRGIYFLYNNNGTLLYIGWACYLISRIRQHINGVTNLKDIHTQIKTVKVLFEKQFEQFRIEHPDCRDIEYYLIEKLNPLCNIQRSKNKAYA